MLSLLHLPGVDDVPDPISLREGFDVGRRIGGLSIMGPVVGLGLSAVADYEPGDGSVTTNLAPDGQLDLIHVTPPDVTDKAGKAAGRSVRSSCSRRLIHHVELIAHAAGLAGTYEICRTSADEQGWDAEKRDLRIRFTDQGGKYAVEFRFKANGPWKPDTDGPYEAQPPSRFRELSGAPNMSPESGAVPDGVRPSKDVPLETVVVPDTAVFMLMTEDWFRRNRETNVPYDTNVIGVFVPKEGRAARRVLLCRV